MDLLVIISCAIRLKLLRQQLKRWAAGFEKMKTELEELIEKANQHVESLQLQESHPAQQVDGTEAALTALKRSVEAPRE